MQPLSKPEPVDWEARKASARAFLRKPPKGKRPWASLTYEYDKTPAEPDEQKGDQHGG